MPQRARVDGRSPVPRTHSSTAIQRGMVATSRAVMPDGLRVEAQAVAPWVATNIRVPLPEAWRPRLAKEWKRDLGAFRNTGGQWNPTYSVDFKF